MCMCVTANIPVKWHNCCYVFSLPKFLVQSALCDYVRATAQAISGIALAGCHMPCSYLCVNGHTTDSQQILKSILLHTEYFAVELGPCV